MPVKTPNKWQIFFGSRWFLLGAFLVALFLAISFGRAYYRDYAVRMEIQKLQAEVKKLEEKKIQTMDILQYVQSSAFVEEKARTELNLALPGENAVVVKDLNKSAGQGDTKMLKLDNIPNPVKWWKFFFGRNQE